MLECIHLSLFSLPLISPAGAKESPFSKASVVAIGYYRKKKKNQDPNCHDCPKYFWQVLVP